MPKNTFGALAKASLMTNTVVSAAPTSTTNITGFFATKTGFSLTNDSFVALLRISGSNKGRARTPREMSAVASCWRASVFFSGGGTVTVDIFQLLVLIRGSEQLAIQHLEVFNNRAERENGEVRQGTDDHDSSDEEGYEQLAVCRQCSAGDRNQLLRGETAGDGQRRNDEHKSSDQHV